jgi:predicted N-acetyltransferase YhbS
LKSQRIAMGKNFHQVKCLSQKPEYLEQTIRLIEKSFQYSAGFSFATDFAPLLHPSNQHNCFILVDQQEQVLAHVGVKEKQLQIDGNTHPICLLGGIAVDEAHRGQGLLQQLMQEVLSEKQSETSLFLLWSNLDQLYAKFGFYQCGDQFEITGQSSEKRFELTKFHQLSPEEQVTIKALYQDSFARLYVTCRRDAHDWQLIEQITSADLYVRRTDGRIVQYFFMNKGQDLTDIIYEYGAQEISPDFLKEISSYGKVWMGKPLVESPSAFYQFLLCPGHTGLFSRLIQKLTSGRINLKELSKIKQEVYFEYDGELVSLSMDDFITGIWGPAPFEEIENDLKRVFISGLDSV